MKIDAVFISHVGKGLRVNIGAFSDIGNQLQPTADILRIVPDIEL